MQQTLLLAVFSIHLFACSYVPLPHTNLCVANPALKHSKCYWLDKDYQEDGTLKPGAKPNFKPLITIDDMNKSIWTDPDSWGSLKGYIKTLREELSSCGSPRQI